MERPYRLRLFNMVMDCCLMKESDTAEEEVSQFKQLQTELILAGLVQSTSEPLEAEVKEAAYMHRSSLSVVVEVLHTCIMKVNSQDGSLNREKRYLHSLSVLGWNTNQPIEEMNLASQAVLRTNFCGNLMMVLDRPLIVTNLHTSKSRHLAMVMDLDDFYLILDESRELGQQVDEMMRQQRSMHYGLTAQQSTDYFKDRNLLRLIRDQLFDSVYGLHARLEEAVTVDSVAPLLKQDLCGEFPLLVDWRRQLVAVGLERYLNGQDDEEQDNELN